VSEPPFATLLLLFCCPESLVLDNLGDLTAAFRRQLHQQSHPPPPAAAALPCPARVVSTLSCPALLADNITLVPEDWQPYQLPIKIAAVNRTVLVHGGACLRQRAQAPQGRLRPATSPARGRCSRVPRA
jgi:hypothetical protein